MSRSILIVDDDETARQRIREVVQSGDPGITVTEAATVEDAQTILREQPVDVIVSEYVLPDGDAATVFETAMQQSVPPACLLFTDATFDDVLDSAVMQYTAAYASKQGEAPYEDLGQQLTALLQDQSHLDYPVPDNEAERLELVEQLDLAMLRSDPAFDALTRLAAEFFDVGCAFIGIITGDSEEFISFEGGATERMPRECTICTFSIMDSGVTVVDDARRDPRFKYVEDIRSLDIAFYAGHPLTVDGKRIGMFCITDAEEHTLTAEEREYLALFAEQATELLVLKQPALTNRGGRE